MKLKAGDRVKVDVHEDEQPIGRIDEVYVEDGEERCTIVWEDTGCSTSDVRLMDCRWMPS